MSLLRFWFTFEDAVRPRTYLRHGVGLMALKYAGDVAESPAPMQEWSIYSRITPPHLDGYLASRRGEFRLVPLPGGRTRLEGSTWYELRIEPQGYWALFSDYLIHRIHLRVLAHIQRQAEAGK